MCGYACIRCGQCGKTFKDVPQLGTCPLCGAANEADVRKCASCGAPLPPRPGVAKRADATTSAASLMDAARGEG